MTVATFSSPVTSLCLHGESQRWGGGIVHIVYRFYFPCYYLILPSHYSSKPALPFTTHRYQRSDLILNSGILSSPIIGCRGVITNKAHPQTLHTLSRCWVKAGRWVKVGRNTQIYNYASMQGVWGFIVLCNLGGTKGPLTCFRFVLYTDGYHTMAWVKRMGTNANWMGTYNAYFRPIGLQIFRGPTTDNLTV